jgi:BlaI family transcriptional regulator, penicillinase repressor
MTMAALRANPSEGELELLTLLWDHGGLSLSEVHDKIGRDVGYTTVQTRLNRLVDKGWVEKAKVGKQPTRYAAVIEPESVRETQLDEFVDKVTQGSVVPLVAHLVQGATLTPRELAELKQLIREAEQRTRKSTGDQP